MKNNKSFKSYLYEFLVLFVAVFMGFLAENFRENLSEKKQERTLIRSLWNDLNTDVARLSELIEENETKVDQMWEFTGIRDLDFGADSNQVHFVEMMKPIMLWTVFPFEPSRASLNQLQGTGLMSSLNASLAREISLYAVILEQNEYATQILIERTGETYKMVYDMTDHIGLFEDPPRIKPFVVDDVFIMRFFNRVADLSYILDSAVGNYKILLEKIQNLIAAIEKEYNLSEENLK